MAVGYAYHEGLGVTQDQSKAIRWYRKSANQGDKYAQYNLGLSYKWGDGVKKSRKLALKWLKLSAKQGYRKAQTRIKELKNV